MSVEFRVVRPAALPAPAPELDPSQRAVVEHRGGPLLVLAGPGTGKTTTLVELVAERVGSGEIASDQVLVLTFSRASALELRARIGARLGGTSVVAAMTFHSFCYGLVREFSDPDAFSSPPELMTAPERDVVVADLLAGHDPLSWPESLRPAVRTRGFAAELQDFMGHLAARDLDTTDLRRLAVERDWPEWLRVADVIDEYHQVADLRNLADYTDLVTRAVGIVSDPQQAEALRDRFRLIVVDEYQDTDPLQVELLRRLVVDGGRDLVAVGDHDQAIYGFRGANVHAIFGFERDFADAGQSPHVLALQYTRRFGERILAASRVVTAPLGTPGGIDPDIVLRHRKLVSTADEPGAVHVETHVSSAAEAENIATALRQAHLTGGFAWSDMAVLVRGSADLSRLQHALVPAGVPVEVAGDELPLAAEPAVRTLLLALELTDDIAHGRSIDPERAHALLSGPLAELDATALRRLGRVLRRTDPDTASAELIARALEEPTLLGMGTLDPGTGATVDRVARLIALLHRAARELAGGAVPEQVLWMWWDGTSWPRRLQQQWESGGEARVVANRDLDAVVALFAHAARTEERARRRSVANFVADLRAQEIPADQLVGAAARPDAVNLMTAHRSKGLQWPLVVVAGVQEELWPDLRWRGSLLKPELLDGVAPSRVERLREERRLFYVACTRAQQRLLVTAVDNPVDDGQTPSRFVRELIEAGFGPAPDAQVLPRQRPARPVSLRGVIAELRSLAASDDADLRDEAAELLAEVADRGLWATRPADPDRWWGVQELTHAARPIRPPDQPLALSGSAVTALSECTLRWFLGREARGAHGSSTAQGFGLVVHALAADVVRIGAEPDAVQLKQRLNEVWSRLGFSAAWVAERERHEAHAAIDRFVAWHRGSPRTAVAAEHQFSVEVVVDGDVALLRGSMDRVDLDADKLVHVVDFKNSGRAPSAAQVAAHPQLGVYQLAVQHGATAEIAPGSAPGGAELVQLRLDASARHPGIPKVQPQDRPSPDQPFFAEHLVAESVRTVRGEQFTATTSAQCNHCDFRSLCPATSTMTVGGAK